MSEHSRLRESAEADSPWRRWGPYISERAWGTVREDYSKDGEAWTYFPQEHARSRAYRWSEDALGGFCDIDQVLCLGLALWNENAPLLTERLFGLSGPEGNHGEDVKEYYFYLDAVPTFSYCRMLYCYPQQAFPYGQLLEENRRRGYGDPEYELSDALADSLEEGRYFDIEISYAKADPETVFCRIEVTNQGPDPAPVHILPQIWYRNTWSWDPKMEKPRLEAAGNGHVRAKHPQVGEYYWQVDTEGELLFTENETNFERLYGRPNPGPYVKDAFHNAVVSGQMETVHSSAGTKAAVHSRIVLAPGETARFQVRLGREAPDKPFSQAEAVFSRRKAEADEFYRRVQPEILDEDARLVQRQAFAGLLWSEQFYHFDVDRWLAGDPGQPPPPESRRSGRNRDWDHLNNKDIISMPDKWEYPWYAAWDLAFHALPLALIDPEFAKRQLLLMLREWYMHPNGQLPAYEWSFSDVNPPVHAWAVWRVYKIDRNVSGQADRGFLERAFHKLLLNFTWWVNRKDDDGNNVFQGGFLGLDNIGVFDRSAELPAGGHVEQADGTAWMGMFCLNMLAIALELARHNPVYEDTATKFFEHFLYIAAAINRQHDQGGLWDENDGFYYDMLHLPDGGYHPLRLRSFVGLIPLYAVETLEPDLLEILPDFKRRMDWFLSYRPDLVDAVASMTTRGRKQRRLLSLVDHAKLPRILQRMLDEDQFLSPYGLRSLSKKHRERPYRLWIGGEMREVRYDPAESTSGLFGGNSNWRGPIWFPTNYLMIESLQKYQRFYGDELRIENPTGSGCEMTMGEVASDLARRLVNLFLRSGERRAVFGENALFQRDPRWRDHILFYEYFNGDDGAGLGASHQTGWTALVAKLIQQGWQNGDFRKS